MSLEITSSVGGSTAISSHRMSIASYKRDPDNPTHRASWISDTDIIKISAVSHVANSGYTTRDVQLTFGWYFTHLVDQIFKFERDVKIESIADIGTGCGWLASAFALKSQVRIVAVDFNERAIVAARQIAKILGVSENIEWCVGSVGRLPLADQEVDATFCIEVIEHTGNYVHVIRDLARITRELLVITSPNKIFPVIRHDTRLPCCHWLPPGRLRDRYAGVFGRMALQENNRFWSPRRFLAALPDFERESEFLQFRNYHDYLEANYQHGIREHKLHESTKTIQQFYLRAASWTGKKSIYFLPSLASTFRRRAHTISRRRFCVEAPVKVRRQETELVMMPTVAGP